MEVGAQTQKPVKRIHWIDISKAIAMILVFYGHLGATILGFPTSRHQFV
ncbi:hypothetical protein PG2006B_1477 [Bifidobacterium animalis subsp. animalis]|nr:hypothetical protein PG2006B_1477 [Bifidobacterium animalis subsp. animalis]